MANTSTRHADPAWARFISTSQKVIDKRKGDCGVMTIVPQFADDDTIVVDVVSFEITSHHLCAIINQLVCMLADVHPDVEAVQALKTFCAATIATGTSVDLSAGMN